MIDWESKPDSGATTAYLYKQVAELRNEVMELKIERDILEEQVVMLTEKLVKLRGNNK